MFNSFLAIFLIFPALVFSQVEEINPDGDISKFLLIRTFESKLVTPAMVARLNKSILMIASKQREYALILSNIEESKVEARTFEIRLLLKLEGNSFKIDTQLYNVQNRKIFRRVRKEDIPRANLVIAVEKALALLFNFKESAEVPKKKKKAIAENTGEIDFMERIRALKKGVQNEIEVQNQKRQRQKNLDSSIKNKAEAEDKKSKYLQTYALGVNYQQSVIESSDLVIIRNSFNYLNLDFQVIRDYLNSFSLLLDLKYGKVISTTEYSLPDYSLIGLRAGFFLPRPYLNFTFGLSREVLTFTNVYSFGSGVFVANNKVIWADIEPRFVLPLDRFDMVLFVRISSSLSISSDYETIMNGSSSSASKLQVGAGIEKIVQMVNFYLKFEKIELASSGERDVSSNYSNFSFHFNYLF